MPLQDDDLFIIGRGNASYKTTYDDLKTKLTADGIGGGGGTGDVEEAPNDGNLYGRQNEDWSEIILEPGISDTNIDGILYGRKDEGWIAIDVLEAPIDGEEYVRKDGAWEISSGSGTTPGTVEIATPEDLTPPDGAGIDSGGSYSSLMTSSDGFDPANPETNLFDNDLNTGVLIGPQGAAGTFTATLTTEIPCTSIEVYVSATDTNVSGSASAGPSETLTSSVGWHSLDPPTDGILRSLVLTRVSTGVDFNGLLFAAVKGDGQILEDSFLIAPEAETVVFTSNKPAA